MLDLYSLMHVLPFLSACVHGKEEMHSITEAVKWIKKKQQKKTRNDCEPFCLFVILHQQWQGHTIPSFTGETPGNEHIVNINI